MLSLLASSSAKTSASHSEVGNFLPQNLTSFHRGLMVGGPFLRPLPEAPGQHASPLAARAAGQLSEQGLPYESSSSSLYFVFSFQNHWADPFPQKPVGLGASMAFLSPIHPITMLTRSLSKSTCSQALLPFCEYQAAVFSLAQCSQQQWPCFPLLSKSFCFI